MSINKHVMVICGLFCRPLLTNRPQVGFLLLVSQALQPALLPKSRWFLAIQHKLERSIQNKPIMKINFKLKF